MLGKRALRARRKRTRPPALAPSLLPPTCASPHPPTFRLFAFCSAATRRCSRKRPRRLWGPTFAPACRPPPCAWASWQSTGEGLGRGWGGSRGGRGAGPARRAAREAGGRAGPAGERALPARHPQRPRPHTPLLLFPPCPAAPRAPWSSLWTTRRASSTSWRSTPGCRRGPPPRCAALGLGRGGAVGWAGAPRPHPQAGPPGLAAQLTNGCTSLSTSTSTGGARHRWEDRRALPARLPDALRPLTSITARRRWSTASPR